MSRYTLFVFITLFFVQSLVIRRNLKKMQERESTRSGHAQTTVTFDFIWGPAIVFVLFLASTVGYYLRASWEPLVHLAAILSLVVVLLRIFRARVLFGRLNTEHLDPRAQRYAMRRRWVGALGILAGLGAIVLHLMLVY